MGETTSCNTISLDHLPNEILEYILYFKEISFVDLCRLSCVCEKLKVIGNSNKLWELKFQKRYFQLSKLYHDQNVDWKMEFRLRHQYGQILAQKVSQMSKKFYLHDEVSNESFGEFKELLCGHHLAYFFLTDELEHILHDGNRNVRTLHRDHSLNVLMQEFQRYNLDILGLQETRLTGKEDSDENKKDTFYSQLHDILNSVKKGDISLVLGDFSSKVGIDSDLWTGVLGPFGIGSLEVVIGPIAMGNVSYSHHRLTDKYYAQRVLRFLRHQHLQEIWANFLEQPTNLQLLENGSIMLSQWCQPTYKLDLETVTVQLNQIANQVKSIVQTVHPKHPVLSINLGHPVMSLEQSLWTPSDCRIILSCLNSVLFQQLKFRGNRADYYCAENSYIDKVLEMRIGIPITLCVIYAAVALRLGVVCLPVNFPGHFLLKWLEHPQLCQEQGFTFVDVFDQGKFLTQKDCNDLISGYQPTTDSWFQAVPPIQVFRRMCWNLVEVGRQLEGMGDGLLCLCNALELLSLLNPDDVEHKLLLARVYLHLNINLTEVISLLQEISAQDPTSTGIVAYMHQAAQSQLAAQRVRFQTRKEDLFLCEGSSFCFCIQDFSYFQMAIKLRQENPSVSYAVGMIMKHKRYKYTCVIYGWDPVCSASRDWISQMGVYNLPNKEKQPFYNVLVEDGTNRYAAQENLEIATEPKPISHIEIGKFFQFFFDTHYVPNDQKESEYPEDAEMRDMLVRQAYSVEFSKC